MADRRDYVALEWVKGEIGETLEQARFALEAYVKAPDDLNRLEFSLAYIHQVHGTLQMVEFFGAALLAEEMELLNQAMVNATVSANDENLAVLMQAIIQLPNYLEQLTEGQLDLPIVVLPLLNDLRAARGEALLSETSLFSPDMSAAYKLAGEPNYDQIVKPQTVQLMRKLRQMYQLALVSLIKSDSQEDTLIFMVKAIGRMVTITERSKNGSLWRVADAFVLALRHGLLSRSPAIVEILREIDMSFRALLKSPIEAAQSFPQDAQLKHLLFYLAKLGKTDIERISQIQDQFSLADALPDETEVHVQRERLSGPDKATVTSVVAALLEELSLLKDALDLMVRTQDTDANRLQNLVPSFQQLADTMAVIGLGHPRRVLAEQIDLIKSVVEKQGIDSSFLMDIAGSLLYVEATLGGIVEDAHLGAHTSGAGAGVSSAHKAVLREARSGIEQVKDSIVEYIGSHFDSVILVRTPGLLAEVRGGLLMVPLNDVSRIVEAVQHYIKDKLIADSYRPDWSEMDALADALVGVEYYLERISRDGSATNDEILERAAQSLGRIGVNVYLSNTDSNSKRFTEDDNDSFEAANKADSALDEPVQSEQTELSVESADVAIDADDVSVEEGPELALSVIEPEGIDHDQTMTIDLSSLDIPSVDAGSINEPDVIDMGNEFEVAVGLALDEAPDGIEDLTSSESTDDDIAKEEDDLIDEEILEIFVEEAAEVLEEINKSYPKYKANADDAVSLAGLRRAFHTLKGSGRMVGADVVSETAWSVENMLNRLIDGSISRSDDLMRVVEQVTGSIPTLMSAFENKVEPDRQKADELAEKAHALSKGESVFWDEQAADNVPVTASNMVIEPSQQNEVDHSEQLVRDELPVAQVDELAVGELPEDIDDALLQVFKAELSSHLDFVDHYLADEPQGQRIPDSLQRALHTIKGSAHTASMDVIAEAVSPVEALINGIQERSAVAEAPFIEVLTQLRNLIHVHAQAMPGMPITEDISTFIGKVQALVDIDNHTEDGEPSEDTSLMTIFLSESMDIVMDAESLLEQWRAAGQPNGAADTLIRELDTLAQAAQAVDLMPVSQLSNELRSLYMAAESNPYLVEEKFFDLAHDGHESLISMMDRLAAGQSIRTDAMFSERLKQLFDVYAVPYHEVLPDLDQGETGKVDADQVDSDHEQDNHALANHTATASLVSELVQPEPASIAPEVSESEAVEAVVDFIDDINTVSAFERHDVTGDPELVEIFLEEATDTIETIQQSFDNWLADTSNSIEVESLQRDLHTLKGGARMAEILPLGDLAHELEYLYEGLAHRQYQLSDQLTALLHQCNDRIASMIGDIESNMSCLSAPDLVDAISNFRRDPSASISIVTVESVTPNVAVAVPEVEESVFEPESVSPDVEEAPGIITESTEDYLERMFEEAEEWSEDVLGASKNTDDIDKGDDSDTETEEEQEKADLRHVELPDDIDLDILEVFSEEAGELLNELEGAIEIWRSEPEIGEHADEVKRVLHTLKGGARLAKLMSLADDSHEFETFIVKTQQRRKPIDTAFFNEVLKLHDILVANIESVQSQLAERGEGGGGFGPSVIQMVAELDNSDHDQQEESDSNSGEPVEQPQIQSNESDSNTNVLQFKAKPQEVETAQPIENTGNQVRRTQPQETVKVSANLLESLVNLAGETSISRARLEQEVSDFGFTLGDMDQTIDRLRDHVRRLDLETEAQIVFRQERAEETNYEDFDPLEMDRYSQIQQLSRSLMEATYDLQDIKTTLNDKTRDAETILLQQSRINTELQEGLMRTRMVPFNRLLPRLRRIVRQVATELGKEVDFVVGNDEGEVDRTVLERMISPLEHLLRNAVDHGIELPDDRQKTNKDPKGTISLDLSREGGDIVLRLEDDGKGIDVNSIRSKAIERGLMTADSMLNDNEIMQFILEAGFSTAEKITQISGRGVGMDVVNSEVKQLGGSIVIDSDVGAGSVFTIRLPFTVSVNRALMVNVLDDLYALPLTSIEGIVRITPKQLTQYYKPDAPLFEYGGNRYRLEYMGALLQTGGRPNLEGIDAPMPLILVRGSDDKHSMALHVDRLLGSREIVVKTLGAQFSRVPGVSGATILGDGSVVIILDLPALIRSDLVIEHQSLSDSANLIASEQKVKRDDRGPAKVLVCDDSVTVRKVTSRLLERNGMEVLLAKDGTDAIAQMIDVVPDLILLDIEMPHMDGFEVASRVRHDERLKHVPIIMITSRTGTKHRERALSIGVNDYMGKPFQEGPLLQNIERLLSEQ